MTLLAEVVRSGYVEGTHHGSVVALRADGSVALAVGDLERPVFPRSSNKPLQAVAMLDAGWEPLSDEQLALATASHNGEPGHLEVVLEMLAELGPQALQCPIQPPLSEAAWLAILRDGGEATTLTMNCSGKHAAMLRTCVANGWNTASYLATEHPVQRACLEGIQRLAGEPVRHVATDGCGAPQHALTLPGLARAFASLATGQDNERRTAHAMTARPWYVGGTGRDVTRLMEAVPGLVAKDGAEGVYAAALPDGSSVALKIDDGAGRARTPVLIAALRALGVEAPLFDELAETPVLGGGRRVGEVRVVGALRSARPPS
ncbi:MAG: L-asparaginase [Frankiales bacterium]|nr:L-asparaginase [Frankiales bacterium]